MATRQYAIMRALKSKLRKQALAAAIKEQQVASAHPQDDARYANLIVHLKDLENLNKVHTHYIHWLRSNATLVRLPTLFSEIFDIPISSKSSTSSTSDAHSLLAGAELVEHELDERHQQQTDAHCDLAGQQHQQLQVNLLADHEDSFFRLAGDFQADHDAADLNPSVLDVVEQL